MEKIDQDTQKIQKIELELVPESGNDERYDGVIHISSRATRAERKPRADSDRRAYRSFSFE